LGKARAGQVKYVTCVCCGVFLGQHKVWCAIKKQFRANNIFA